MAENDFLLDLFKAMCATAWIMFFLILKNVVLLILMTVQRRRNAMYRIPEDVNTFGAGQQQDNVNDWSLAGRIQRVLANDTEYVPYFMILLIFIFCSVNLTGQATDHHYLPRVLIYGISFVIGRYLHTIAYLLRNSYGRIIGYLITILMLFVLSIDHAYYMSKQLYNYTPKP